LIRRRLRLRRQPTNKNKHRDVLKTDRVEAGQEFDVERVDRGEYRLIRRTAPPNEGAIAWLLACPQKDFFVPIDSESTDVL